MSIDIAQRQGTPAEPLGPRLRRAREDMGLTQQGAAAALRLPASVIDALESDQPERIGAAVYVMGHLRSYLRLLKLPEALASRAAAQIPAELPALQSTTHVPHLRFLADRYAARAVYVVLTLSIIVPAFWVATQRPALDPQQASRLLDAPPPAVAAVSAPEGSVSVPPVTPAAEAFGPPESLRGPLPEARDEAADTVLASMAPFYPGSQQAMASPVNTTPGDGAWEFHFSGESWVEIIGSDGERLAYGLLKAGDVRRFERGSVGRVALGNASAVRVLREGAALDVSAFQRANVARFAVSSDGSLTAATH